MKTSIKYSNFLIVFIVALLFSLDMSAQIVVIRPRRIPPPIYYAPPPRVYYAPPPVYYAPPPPVIIVQPRHRHRGRGRRW